MIELIDNEKAFVLAKQEYLKATKNAMILLLKSNNGRDYDKNDYAYYKKVLRENFSLLDILRMGGKGIIQIVLCLYFPFMYSIGKN